MHDLHVKWIHDQPDDPVEIFSEIDENSWETRKVEVFPDGKVGFADPLDCSGLTMLGIEKVPSLAEIASDPQFQPRKIDQAEFDRVWQLARSATSIRQRTSA